MLLNRRGTFHALAVNRGVDETGESKLMTLTCQFQITEERVGGGQYNDVSAEGLEITGYFYIEKKDGSLNVHAHKSIMESFHWDGRDPFQIQDDPKFGEIPVQIVCDLEEYQGNSKIKVLYLNPHGSSGSGGVTRANEATRKAMMNRIGSALRAAAGPSTAGRPAVPPATPAAPSAPTRIAPTARPSRPHAAARKSDQQAAWLKFTNEVPKDWDQSATEKEWFRILNQLFPGITVYTPEQYAEFEDKAPSLILPF